jgi:hypothetical protein
MPHNLTVYRVNGNGVIFCFGYQFLLHDPIHFNANIQFPRWYLVIQGVSMILSLVFVAIYFPSRPQFAPTASAVAARLNITEVIITLFCLESNESSV